LILPNNGGCSKEQPLIVYEYATSSSLDNRIISRLMKNLGAVRFYFRLCIIPIYNVVYIAKNHYICPVNEDVILWLLGTM
jgi:hypothetical protein